jgi:hypothetical protein
VGRKLGGRAAIASTAQAGRPGRLGVLVDKVTSVVFLIDTGAVFSVVPYTSDQPAIQAADGMAISFWGWHSVTVVCFAGALVRSLGGFD